MRHPRVSCVASWPRFPERATLIGDWVAVGRVPRTREGAGAICDACHGDRSPEATLVVACSPSREDGIRRGLAAANPQAGETYCTRCAQRYLPPLPPVRPGWPCLWTSHSPTGWPLVPVTGFRLTTAGGDGRPLQQGWRNRLPCGIRA